LLENADRRMPLGFRGRLPPAYVNCPMAPFGIYAHKDNSIVTIKLEREGPKSQIMDLALE
jgi:hypothetical protein